MGIQYLWPILAPFCERKPLYHLQGKSVAVDLSCWVCEAQNISEYEIQPRMYLRNLYFRTSFLLLMEVIPVFVLEGKAPELKYDTIAARNAIQFKGAKPKTEKTKTGKDRSRFHHILKRCEEMIGYMGLACVKGEGEAESMCAYLNCDGLVAGCISQDSDCFAYGAKVVYRNFSISSQGNQSASGGAVDVYDIEKAYETLRFGRNKIITLALLCGSDYNDGVHGIGKESAIKFMNRYSDEEILDHLRSWRYTHQKYKDLENKITDKKICTSCGHKGTVQSHSKSGCSECTTSKGCDFSKFREQRLEIKNEISVRNKALTDPDFPNEKLISEYLIRKDDVQKLNLKWKQPNMVAFVKFTNKFLGWEEIYAFEKFLPILTRWQILNFEYIQRCITQGRTSEIKGTLQPDYIKKIRNPKGIPSYEIIWKDCENVFEYLIPEDQIEKYKETNGNIESLWSTIEPQNAVQKAFPEMVEKFLESKTKKGKKVTKRKKSSKDVNDLSEMLANTSISEPKVKKTRRKVEKVDKNQKTLENFLAITLEKGKTHINIQDENLEPPIATEMENQTMDTQKPKTRTRKKNSEPKKSKTKARSGDIEIESEVQKSKTKLQIENVLPPSPTEIKIKNPLIESLKKVEAFSNSFDLDASCFGDENDPNFSDIIENILNRSPNLPEKIKKLGYHFQNFEFETISPVKPLKSWNRRNANESYNLDEDQNLNFSDEERQNFNYSSPIVKENKFQNLNVKNCFGDERVQNFDYKSPIVNFRNKNLFGNGNVRKNPECESVDSPIVRGRRSSFFEINHHNDLFEKILDKKNLSDDEKCCLNQSSFFETNFKEDGDLFEKSMNKNQFSDSDSEGTIDYEVQENENLEGKLSDSDDDFLQGIDVPLIDRIKNLKK